jgi:hypothetical protein
MEAAMQPALETIRWVVLATDLAMIGTVLSLWWALATARPGAPSPWVLALPLAGAFLWGAAWAFVPSLAAQRSAPPPLGQAGAIIGLVIALNALRVLPITQRYFASANPARLLTMGLWRPVYGAALIVLGINGGLPDAFFWSAGFGDIAVGLWAIALLSRRHRATTLQLVVWNIAGALDLAHVLVLGALTLNPFYLSHPGVAPLNLLPLAGVPLFLALHILTLTGFATRRRSQTAMA